MYRLFATLLLLVAACASAAADADRWKREGWQTDFSKAQVPLEEIMSGGPPRDGIPSIDDPAFRKAAEIETVGEREPVIRLELGGEVRAYPLQVLTWHEIVNDVVAGVPVAVTFCPLCNASLVFDRRLGDRVLEFGTTGKLRNSDLVMYDRQTESWWQQFIGEAIVGALAGERLDLVPSRVVSFAAFRAENPEAPVLVPNDPDFRDYGRNPYPNYDSAALPFLYRGDLPEGIPPMARVVVVRGGEEILIVGLEKVRREGYDRAGVEIMYEAGVASALDAADMADGRDVGSVRVLRDGTDVPHDVTFAFVAHAFHPDVPIVME